jgi:hypothetical protein
LTLLPEESIMLQCLLITATIHTESGRSRIERSATNTRVSTTNSATHPIKSDQFQATLKDCLAEVEAVGPDLY